MRDRRLEIAVALAIDYRGEALGLGSDQVHRFHVRADRRSKRREVFAFR